MRAAALTIALLLVAGATALLVVVGSGDDGDAPPTATVDFESPGRTLPPQSIGLSVEWEAVSAYRAPGFARLVERLERESGSRVHLRVGGNSCDQSWWNPDGERRPPTVLFDITPRDARLARMRSRGVSGVAGDARR